MRRFYLLYPIAYALRRQLDKPFRNNINERHLQSILRQELSWTHWIKAIYWKKIQ